MGLTKTESTPQSKFQDWSPASWREFPVKQQATYPDEKALNDALDQSKFYLSIEPHVLAIVITSIPS